MAAISSNIIVVVLSKGNEGISGNWKASPSNSSDVICCSESIECWEGGQGALRRSIIILNGRKKNKSRKIMQRKRLLRRK